MKEYVFDEDALNALEVLLSLVHFDDLATQWYRLLPAELQHDLGLKPLLDEELDQL